MTLELTAKKEITFFLVSMFFGFKVAFPQINDTINISGSERSFVYYVPSSWSQSDNYPLLFVLHGLTQTGTGLMNITGFNDIAEQENFIVCYPDGKNGAWNANMNVSVSQENDLDFIEKLAIYFQSTRNTDPNRQYLCGISNGGFLSHKIACESNQCFAAIATVAGTMSDTVAQNCNPQFSTSVLHMHGTADGVVSYYGSPSTGISADDLMLKWKTYLSCDTTPMVINMPNPNILDLSYPVKYTYSNCTDSELELIKIVGGGHQWPGIATVWGGVGNINMDFYAPQIIWDFLAGKSCNNLAGRDEISEYSNHEIIKIIDLTGRESGVVPNKILILIYKDGRRKKVFYPSF